MSVALPNVDVLERMVRAVEKVRERLLRASKALEDAGVRYAVIGGNAVAAWVATVDEAAVRNTRDVDILLDPDDFALARKALEADGFIYRHVAGGDLFLDGPAAQAADAVHIVFARQKVRPLYVEPAPDVRDTVSLGEGLRVVPLEALVRMKLTSFRDRDRTHLRDLIGVGLITERDLADLSDLLAARLTEILENPEG
jgi:predicted nucleotidyltransferase